MSITLGVKRPFYSTVNNWLLISEQGIWALKTKNVLRDQLKWQFQKMWLPFILWSWTIEEYPLKRYVAETLAISWERLGSIIHEILELRKLSAKWVPKCLNDDQKRDRVLASQAILDPLRRDPVEFFNRLVTMDETWIHMRPKNNPRNGDTVVPGVQRSSR
jgi:hypothetical protein